MLGTSATSRPSLLTREAGSTALSTGVASSEHDPAYTREFRAAHRHPRLLVRSRGCIPDTQNGQCCCATDHLAYCGCVAPRHRRQYRSYASRTMPLSQHTVKPSCKMLQSSAVPSLIPLTTLVKRDTRANKNVERASNGQVNLATTRTLH